MNDLELAVLEATSKLSVVTEYTLWAWQENLIQFIMAFIKRS